MSKYEALFERHPSNPILTSDDWPYPAHTVFNAGATLLQDGTTLLLCRVEDRTGLSHLTVARSQNGIDGWEIDPEPTFTADPANYPEELWGVEDPRITFVPERDEYLITYTAYGPQGPGVSLASTKDFREFKRLGVALPPEDKDAALLPRKIGGRWAMVHRPVPGYAPQLAGAHIWMSFSDDLSRWGDPVMIIQAREGGWWDARKIGLCSPPIETPEGWLVIYHGVRTPCSGCIYRLGLALLDLENPGKCLLRGDQWVMGPETPYEMLGDVGNVVFPCGQTIGKDGDTLNLYYGAADTVMALATSKISTLLDWLHKHGSE
jgi:predicted GH43/DUF377 family glycosyl hydrolase